MEAAEVESVPAGGRHTFGLTDLKLSELVLPELFDLAVHHQDLTKLDACFSCLGVSATGMSGPEYHRVTYHLMFAALDVLFADNPRMAISFVFGQGADSTGGGRIMWARVKGQTENELLSRFLPSYIFRPGVIQPLRGVRSKTMCYQAVYFLLYTKSNRLFRHRG